MPSYSLHFYRKCSVVAPKILIFSIGNHTKCNYTVFLKGPILGKFLFEHSLGSPFMIVQKTLQRRKNGKMRASACINSTITFLISIFDDAGFCLLQHCFRASGYCPNFSGAPGCTNTLHLRLIRAAGVPEEFSHYIREHIGANKVLYFNPIEFQY